MKQTKLAKYRSRGLNKMEDKFGKNLIRNFIKQRLKSEKIIRILELGFGEGHCLIDLRYLFPEKNVELYGININKKGNMHKQSDFLANAKLFGVNIPKTNLPKPYFYDAGNGLKFKDNFFDLIISQVAIHYIGDKAKFLEDVWRTLKPQGKSFLHVDSSLNQAYPDFMHFNSETPRFIIYKNNKMIKTSKYLNQISKKGFNIKLKISRLKEKRLILITKNTKKQLKLNLNYDGNSTLFLTNLKNTDKYKTDSGIWWGTRSVFKLK